MNSPFIESTSVDDNEMAVLFGEEVIPTPNNLKQEQPEEKETKPKKSDNSPNPEIQEEEVVDINIAPEDFDSLLEEIEDTDESEEVVENKKPTKKQVANQINYKAHVDYLISTGKWKDWEGREELEAVSEEDYTKLIELQDEARVKEKFNEELDTVGDVGKYIIEYTKNGGKAENLISLFREQRDIQNLDLATPEDQEEVIRAYLEFQDESEEDIKDFIDTAKDKGSEYFENLAKRRHQKLLEINKQEIDATLEEQKSLRKRQEETVKQFNTSIKNNIYKSEDLTDSEKKQIDKFMLSYDYQLPDGKKVTSLYAKILEIQQDPQKLIKLAQFVSDMGKFEQKIANKVEKKVTEKTFNFINSSQNLKHKKDTLSPDVERTKAINPFDNLKFKS